MPPGPIGRGPGLCPRGGAGAAYLPANVLCSPAHRLWGRAFALPFGVGGGRFFGATKRPLRTAGAERRQWRKKRGGSPVRKGVAGSCLGVGEKPSGGGRRLGAKRPERAWPGAFGPGPRSFVWLAGGPQGPRPPNAAAPPGDRPGAHKGRSGRHRLKGRALIVAVVAAGIEAFSLFQIHVGRG